MKRYTEYHAGVAVIKDKTKMKEAMQRFAELEERDSNRWWIPCSERLPEESGYYLACIHDSKLGDYDIRRIWFAHADDYDMVKHDWRELEEYENVTAWQPLPEPYTGEDNNE